MEGNGAKGKRGEGRKWEWKRRVWNEREGKGGKGRKGIELYSRLALIDDNSKNKRDIDSTNDVKKDRDTNHINANDVDRSNR